MTLEEFFGVTSRTISRWRRAGVDLSSAEEIVAYVQGLQRPSENVQARAASATFTDDLARVLAGGSVKEPVAALTTPLKAAKLRKLQLECERIEMQLQVEKGELVPRKTVFEQVAKAGAALVANLQAISEDSAVIAGCSEEQVRQWLKRREEEVAAKFKAALSAIA